ncbi:MAG: CsgG/HfaB family protein [candidate division KSB1 bacterium]|nr:CsgG/HfaB family protein [candidate division KSB1 bacterium]MDZ7276252.1 CsgG/HfaB family protein [candidate division KSB1 bacterium]MDZ7287942.1 CsgG/HfaB family protein [candidate division KSB1 bacterium]MDZ7300045.1 CsgG/HfaB family protein [candidate division KSB1 bacterium]MDZ7308753.1 CsgG/HfaB family protein [candidate division KSB1 bacterium]
MRLLPELLFCLTAALSLAFRLAFAQPPPLRPAAPATVPADSLLTVAVLDFKNNSGLFHLDLLEKNVPEMLQTELSRPGSGILVVARQKLELILQEQALGQTGVIDQQTAQAVGQLAGAQYLLTGEISMAGSRLRIDCHILKVATGQVRGEKVVGRDWRVGAEMVQLLAANILYNLTGRGQYRESVRLRRYPASWVALAAGLSAAAAGVTHGISRAAYRKYQAATTLADLEKHYHRAEDYRTARTTSALVTGVLALVSVRFWLQDHSEKNRIFAAAMPAERPPAPRLALFAGGHTLCLGVAFHF